MSVFYPAYHVPSPTFDDKNVHFIQVLDGVSVLIFFKFISFVYVLCLVIILFLYYLLFFGTCK